MNSFKGSLWRGIGAAAILAVGLTSSTKALTYGTVVFEDGFEGFTAGTSLLDGTEPSTGIGTSWDRVSGENALGTISNAQAFGGVNSLNLTRTTVPFRSPRYRTFPEAVAEADTTANSVFGTQFDVYLTERSPGVLSDFNIGLAPGGVDVSAGQIISQPDGRLRAYVPSQGGYDFIGTFMGAGWHTFEITHALGADNGGVADDLVSVYLTRHAGNSAGVLPRALIYQYTDSLTLGRNYRLDFSNNGDGTMFLDNVQLGNLVPEPTALLLAAIASVFFVRCRTK